MKTDGFLRTEVFGTVTCMIRVLTWKHIIGGSQNIWVFRTNGFLRTYGFW